VLEYCSGQTKFTIKITCNDGKPKGELGQDIVVCGAFLNALIPG